MKPQFYTVSLRFAWILDEITLLALFLLKIGDKKKTCDETLVGSSVGTEKQISFIPKSLRLSKESQPIKLELCVMSYRGH